MLLSSGLEEKHICEFRAFWSTFSLLFLLNRFVAERFNDDSVDDECPKLLVVLRIVDSLMAMKFDDV